MKIVLVEPGKAARLAEIQGGLASMQEVVGGYIQALYPWKDPVALICNDEWKLNQLPWNRVLEDYDIIAGTFFICGIQGENFTGLTDRLAKKYQQMFRCPEKFLPTPQGFVCLKIEPVAVPKSPKRKPPDYDR